MGIKVDEFVLEMADTFLCLLFSILFVSSANICQMSTPVCVGCRTELIAEGKFVIEKAAVSVLISPLD